MIRPVNTAMNIIHIHRGHLAKARTNVRHHRYREWRGRVEEFKTAAGARPVLINVPEEVWLGRFAANDDAISAVVEQLEGFDD